MTAKDYLRRIRQLDDAASAAQLELERIESTVTRVRRATSVFLRARVQMMPTAWQTPWRGYSVPGSGAIKR